MTTSTKTLENPTLLVIHPLDDVMEQKRSADGLGLMQMSKTVRLSLISLRIYLIFILAIAVYHMVDLFGLLGHHPSR